MWSGRSRVRHLCLLLLFLIIIAIVAVATAVVVVVVDGQSYAWLGFYSKDVSGPRTAKSQQICIKVNRGVTSRL